MGAWRPGPSRGWAAVPVSNWIKVSFYGKLPEGQSLATLAQLDLAQVF